MENRRRSTESIEVTPEIVDVVNPVLGDGISVKDDMLGTVATNDELPSSPGLILDGGPSVDSL
jgi:hypothetical protein